MSPTKAFKQPFVIAAIGLCLASLFVESMLQRADEALLKSHQKRWDCWAEQSHQVPRCVALANQKPVDADYCSEAVSACKANGAHRAVRDAEATQSNWRKLAASVRLAWLVAVCSLLVRFGSVMAVGWELESAGGVELLRVSFNDRRIRLCELQLKPHVRIEWSMTWG